MRRRYFSRVRGWKRNIKNPFFKLLKNERYILIFMLSFFSFFCLFFYTEMLSIFYSVYHASKKFTLRFSILFSNRIKNTIWYNKKRKKGEREKKINSNLRNCFYISFFIFCSLFRLIGHRNTNWHVKWLKLAFFIVRSNDSHRYFRFFPHTSCHICGYVYEIQQAKLMPFRCHFLQFKFFLWFFFSFFL